MLVEEDSCLYAYAITRDFGFAPNPFHGVCTLATCKPRIRKSAAVGDWILGVGGRELGAVYRKCIFLMKVTEKTDFQRYWDDPRFRLKKPVRNGSNVQMLGDNIYHRDAAGEWIQEDSHHSNEDGTYNLTNLRRDTGLTDSVLISRFFFYFGCEAVPIDLASLGYERVRDYIKKNITPGSSAHRMIENIHKVHRTNLNVVIADPCQFDISDKRVDQGTGKLT